MGQDIRQMFRNEEHLQKDKLPEGHQNRFEARLQDALPLEKKKKDSFHFWQIAAVMVVVLGIGAFFFFSNSSDLSSGAPQIADTPVETSKDEKEKPDSEYRLSDISPEFKKVEDYYMASLNIQLAKLDMTPNNKELIDAFMKKLETLNQEYIALNAEIQETGLSKIPSLYKALQSFTLGFQLLSFGGYNCKARLNSSFASRAAF